MKWNKSESHYRSERNQVFTRSYKLKLTNIIFQHSAYVIYIIGHILRTSYSIAQYWWIFSNIIWFGSIFLDLNNISIYFAISKNIKRSFSAKNVKKRNHMYQKLKLLLINSLSRQPLHFSASYSNLKYLKGLQILRGYWHWEGRYVFLTCKVDLQVSNKIIDII